MKLTIKKASIICFSVLYLIAPNVLNGQAAILALLFGDKVASENFNLSMEFGVVLPGYDNIENKDNIKRGINFGIAGNVRLSDNWYLSPNAYFLARRNLQLSSFSLNSANSILNEEFRDVPAALNMGYIDLPVFIHYQTNNRKWRFGAGPQLSILRSAEAEYSGSEGTFDYDVKDQLNSIDYGMVGDIVYVLGKAHKGRGIHIHLRYYQGFSDVFDNSFISGKNQSRFFSVHVSLPFITDELAAKNLERE